MNLPDKYKLLELITLNKQDEILSLLNPLSNEDRHSAVNQQIKRKSMLFYAYKSGFDNIINYLQIECGAVLQDGYWNSEVSWSLMKLFSTDKDDRDFMAACENGDLSAIDSLIPCGINMNFRNEKEENALCIAILNNQEQTVNYLVNKNIYSLKSYVLTLELCGAKFIVFHSALEKGIECWRKSLEIRKKQGLGFQDKIKMKFKTNLGVEFKTIKQIEKLRKGRDGNVYLQALIIFLRLLPKSSLVVQDAFLTVAKHTVFKNNLLQSIKIIAELYRFPTYNKHGIPDPVFTATHTLLNLFHFLFLDASQNEIEYMRGFRKLIKFFLADNWRRILRSLPNIFQFFYEEMIEIMLLKIHLQQRLDLSTESVHWIRSSIKNILSSTTNLKTMMYIAILRQFPLRVFSFLLECSSETNFKIHSGNTPLHLISRLQAERSYLISLVSLFLEAGAHIDSVNDDGIRPVETLKSRNLVNYPFNFMKLKCLAAQTIQRYNITINKPNISEALLKLLEIHLISPIN